MVGGGALFVSKQNTDSRNRISQPQFRALDNINELLHMHDHGHTARDLKKRVLGSKNVEDRSDFGHSIYPPSILSTPNHTWGWSSSRSLYCDWLSLSDSDSSLRGKT